MVNRMAEIGALGMVAVAILVVAWLALRGSEPALGAMISVVAAGISFFLRGRVSPPS